MNKQTDYPSNEYLAKGKLGTDSEGLGAWGDKKTFVVGHVPEVNGSEACEAAEFVPTKHELIQIAKYWERRRLHIGFWFFLAGMSGSSEWRESVYASRRIDRIAGILPEEELTQALEEAERAFKQEWKISDDDWNIFKNGTQEQWHSYQDKLREEFERKNGDLRQC